MGTQVSEVKKILRQQMREAMAEMTEQEKAWSDQELVSAFLAHPKLDEANTVMLYYGVGQEIATADLIQTLLDQGKTVCLPKCLPEHQMEARIIQSLDELEPDAYGIPAPKDACPVLEREKIDLIWSPACALTARAIAWARAAAITTAIWRTLTGTPSACAGRISFRSTCRGSLWMPLSGWC